MSRVHKTASVISIGDELVLGQSLDTNSCWLSERLAAMGITVVRHTTIGDDLDILSAAMASHIGSVDLVICTGGLGPTEDDLTRAALAAATCDELVEDADSIAAIESWYGGRQNPMPKANQRQAYRPSRAVCLRNRSGTAPGLWVALGRTDLCCLPGPPHEMRAMFEEAVAGRVNTGGDVIATRLLHTIGIGESAIADRLGDLMARDRNPKIGTTADVGAVGVRIRYEGDSASAPRAIEESEQAVRAAISPHVFGADDDSLAGVLIDMLRKRAERIAVAESCTGGLIGARLTDVAGSSDVMTGGWITYTNGMKAASVGVPSELFGPNGPGAVSREVAVAMARGALERAVYDGGVGVEHAIGVTGIAGPGGGTEAKPVGTVWIAIASSDGAAEARRFVFRGDRAGVREWSVQSALGALWMRLGGHGDAQLLREYERWSG